MNKVSPPAYAGPPPGSPEQVRAIIAELRRLYPDAKISLNFSNPLELLVATQLSAQSTDERVNMVTAELFKKYRRVEDYATVSREEGPALRKKPRSRKVDKCGTVLSQVIPLCELGESQRNTLREIKRESPAGRD